MPELLTIDDFLPYVGRLVRFGDTAFVMPIDRVLGDRDPPTGWPRAPFTVIFRGAPTPVLAEGLYECAVEGGPVWSLYVMPVQTHDGACQDYQAVFS